MSRAACRGDKAAQPFRILAAGFSLDAIKVFGNINGCVLLLEVLFFRWILDGKVGHQWWAGVAIGLSLVVKPVLAPLLLLPLLNRQWRAVVTAIAVPKSPAS